MIEQTVNIPIQMFCVCSTIGDITPVRFRFESEDHGIETVKINRIIALKESRYNGINELHYTCEASMQNISKFFTITYNVATHKWRLFKLLS